MRLIKRIIRLFFENIPIVMFSSALLLATFVSDIPVWPERYLAWLLLLAVGVQGVWAGVVHVFFPNVGARYIGWTSSPFQTELGVADMAMGCIAILSFWQGMGFRSAVVIYVAIFYLGVACVHVRDMKNSGNREKGNFGVLLAMTFIKAVGLPVLLWSAYSS